MVLKKISFLFILSLNFTNMNQSIIHLFFLLKLFINRLNPLFLNAQRHYERSILARRDKTLFP